MAFSDLLSVADGVVQRTLGGPITYRPQFGDAVAVRGIFDPAYRRQDDATLPGVANVGPAVFLRLADLPDDPAGRFPAITVEGTDYRVREAQKDGMGGVLLHLLKA